MGKLGSANVSSFWLKSLSKKSRSEKNWIKGKKILENIEKILWQREIKLGQIEKILILDPIFLVFITNLSQKNLSETPPLSKSGRGDGIYCSYVIVTLMSSAKGAEYSFIPEKMRFRAV